MVFNIIKMLIPSITKTKSKISAVDTLISKRGEATKIEVILAISEKIIRTIIYAYTIWAIVNNKVNFGEILKIWLANK